MRRDEWGVKRFDSTMQLRMLSLRTRRRCTGTCEAAVVFAFRNSEPIWAAGAAINELERANGFNIRLRSLRRTNHGNDCGRRLGFDLANDFETEAFVKRDVPQIRSFKIHRQSVGIAACDAVAQ